LSSAIGRGPDRHGVGELLEPERVTALEHPPVLQGLGEELEGDVLGLPGHGDRRGGRRLGHRYLP